MLQISNLIYRYPDTSVPQLSVPALSLAAGEHAVILGPSGCGKSTLLHLIAAILSPQQGTLRVAGIDAGTLSGRAADAWRGATVGFLPQKLSLVPSLSVRENLLLSAYANGNKTEPARIEKLLRELGLIDKADAKPYQLSQGQQQRAALARAMVNHPRLLLADEPTSNLDDTACAASLHLLHSHAEEEGASLVIATHDTRVLNALPHAKVLRLQPAAGETP